MNNKNKSTAWIKNIRLIS